MGDLINLPPNMLYLLLSKLKLSDLLNICTTSKELDSICRNQDFWAFKYNQDFSEPFPTQTGNISPRTIYLRRRIQILDDQLIKLKDQLKNRLYDIFMSAASEDEKEGMERIFNKLYPFYVYEYPREKGFKIRKLEEALEVDECGVNIFFDALEEALMYYFSEEGVTQINNVTIDWDNLQNPEEVEQFYGFMKTIIQTFIDYSKIVNPIISEIDYLFDILSQSPFEKSYRYLTRKELRSIEDIDSENKRRMTVHRPLSRYDYDLPEIPDDTNLQVPPLPMNLPPPPPRAPMLSRLSRPRVRILPPYPPSSPLMKTPDVWPLPPP